MGACNEDPPAGGSWSRSVRARRCGRPGAGPAARRQRPPPGASTGSNGAWTASSTSPSTCPMPRPRAGCSPARNGRRRTRSAGTSRARPWCGSRPRWPSSRAGPRRRAPRPGSRRVPAAMSETGAATAAATAGGAAMSTATSMGAAALAAAAVAATTRATTHRVARAQRPPGARSYLASRARRNTSRLDKSKLRALTLADLHRPAPPGRPALLRAHAARPRYWDDGAGRRRRPRASRCAVTTPRPGWTRSTGWISPTSTGGRGLGS